MTCRGCGKPCKPQDKPSNPADPWVCEDCLKKHQRQPVVAR